MKLIIIIQQIYKYTIKRKKYWILPFAIMLVALAIILVSMQGTVIAPFLYTVF